MVKNTYEKYALEFERNTKNFIEEYLVEDTNFFLNNLPGELILDLGCGPGLHSEYFRKKGFIPLCLDNSLKMIERCYQKSLNTIKTDMEKRIPLMDSSMDGVWAYASLFRCVEKSKVPGILKDISRILKPNGIFSTSAREGSFEGWKEDRRYPNSKRYDVFYQEKEIEDMLLKNFKIIKKSKTPLQGKNYLNYFCSKMQQNL